MALILAAAAYLGAEASGGGAHVQHPSGDVLIRAGVAGGKVRRGVADSGTVEIQPYALDKVAHGIFGWAGVGAGGAVLDALQERFVNGAANIGMGLHNLAQLLHGSSPSMKQTEGLEAAAGRCANADRL